MYKEKKKINGVSSKDSNNKEIKKETKKEIKKEIKTEIIIEIRKEKKEWVNLRNKKIYNKLYKHL